MAKHRSKRLTGSVVTASATHESRYSFPRPLSEVSLANMFSHTVGSLLILMLFSLAMQKLFHSTRSHLFILSFMSLALGDISVKMLLCGMSEIFLLMFSSRTFDWANLDYRI